MHTNKYNLVELKPEMKTSEFGVQIAGILVPFHSYFRRNHSIVNKLKTLFEKNLDDSLLEMSVFLLLENQELTEGVLTEPSQMVERIHKLLEKAID